MLLHSIKPTKSTMNFFSFGPMRQFSTKKKALIAKTTGKNSLRRFRKIAALFTATKAHKCRQRLYNSYTRKDLKVYAKSGIKTRKTTGTLVAKLAYFTSTIWRLRFFGFRRSTTTVATRIAAYRSYAQTPHVFYPVPHYVHATRSKYNPGPVIVRNQL